MFGARGVVILFTSLALAAFTFGCSDDGGGTGGNGTGGTGGNGTGGNGGNGTGGNGGAAPIIEMTAPSGGVPVQPGNVVTIEWTADSDVTGVDLSYTTDTAGTVGDPVMIEMGVAGSSYEWTTPSGPLFGVKIKGVATNAAGDTGEDETDDIFAVVAFSARGYVQGATCGSCHADHDQWVFQESGHPYKLNKVNGAPPTYPPNTSPGVPNPPIGPPMSTWNDVTYVIGGYGWKARFLGTEGYIIGTGFGPNPTEGGNNQWNFVYTPATWTDYHKDDAERKPYDAQCGSCHNTGWVPDLDAETDDDLMDNQDMLPGIHGTWEETGVTCEQCHTDPNVSAPDVGGGAKHVSTQSKDDISKDRSSELCGTCHNRGGANTTIPASGDLPNTFIRHHEQYNEWANSAHGDGDGMDVGCNDCHNPHIGTRYGFAAEGGIIATCASAGCHDDVTTNKHQVAAGFPIACERCHMPQATKSAVPDPDNLLYVGDVKTHIFKINAASASKATFFDFSGASPVVATPTAGVTLDFVCYQCHNDPAGNGGGGSEKDATDLTNMATDMHN